MEIIIKELENDEVIDYISTWVESFTKDIEIEYGKPDEWFELPFIKNLLFRNLIVTDFKINNNNGVCKNTISISLYCDEVKPKLV